MDGFVTCQGVGWGWGWMFESLDGYMDGWIADWMDGIDGFGWGGCGLEGMDGQTDASL